MPLLSPAHIPINFTSPETRRIVLPEAGNHIIVSSFIWTQYRNVTYRQTDRQNPSGYYSVVHCKQCGHAVIKAVAFISGNDFNAIKDF